MYGRWWWDSWSQANVLPPWITSRQRCQMGVGGRYRWLAHLWHGSAMLDRGSLGKGKFVNKIDFISLIDWCMNIRLIIFVLGWQDHRCFQNLFRFSVHHKFLQFDTSSLLYWLCQAYQENSASTIPIGQSYIGRTANKPRKKNYLYSCQNCQHKDNA